MSDGDQGGSCRLAFEAGVVYVYLSVSFADSLVRTVDALRGDGCCVVAVIVVPRSAHVLRTSSFRYRSLSLPPPPPCRLLPSAVDAPQPIRPASSRC